MRLDGQIIDIHAKF